MNRRMAHKIATTQRQRGDKYENRPFHVTPVPHTWNVQPYRPIAKLEENLWTVDGDIRVPGGSILVRKMTLIKFTDGRIAIHSPIALHEEDMQEIERWGE